MWQIPACSSRRPSSITTGHELPPFVLFHWPDLVATRTARSTASGHGRNRGQSRDRDRNPCRNRDRTDGPGWGRRLRRRPDMAKRHQPIPRSRRPARRLGTHLDATLPARPTGSYIRVPDIPRRSRRLVPSWAQARAVLFHYPMASCSPPFGSAASQPRLPRPFRLLLPATPQHRNPSLFP